ncbi:MAG: hypothetical protein HKN04_09640 [Rhodothermaceae bacterium]|nr:hypothetical protein [Rhodothermaceae bacterium]
MTRFALLIALGTVALLAGCDYSAPTDTLAVAEAPEALIGTGGLSATTLTELQQVRQKTRGFHDINFAQDHGYVQVTDHVPNMGMHFVRFAWVDGTFDRQHPEALLYVDDGAGHLEFVAVEYIVPFEASASAPRGFTGTADVWHADEELGSWTLHAWIWKGNPDGVFAPFNSLVP